MSTEAALLAAIAAQPDDDTPRLVYADWLDENGRPERAEFIRAQVELARPVQHGELGRRRKLRARVKELHKLHAARWAEPVFDAAGVRKDPYWRETTPDGWDRGFLGWVEFESVAAFRRRVAAVTALGPLTVLSLRKFTVAEVDRLAGVRALRTVRGLVLCGRGWGNGDDRIDDATAARLAASPHLSRLEELDLTQNRLTTEGVRAIAYSAQLPALKKLRLYGNEINNDTYRMLVKSPLAARMTEWNVDGSMRINSGAARVIAQTPTLSHITSLSFDNTEIRDDGAEALAGATHLAGVRSLNFRNTPLTHLAVRAIVRSPVFANLEELNFVKTWINGIGARFLRESRYLKKIKDIALYDAVPYSSEKKLKERFGRKVDFGRR